MKHVFRYRFPRGYWVGGLAAAVAGGALYLGAMLLRVSATPGEDRVAPQLAAAVFAGLAVPLIAWLHWRTSRWVRNAWVRIDNTGISACGPNGAYQLIPWAEVREVKFGDGSLKLSPMVGQAAFMDCTVIGTGKHIHVPWFLERGELFCEALWKTDLFEVRNSWTSNRSRWTRKPGTAGPVPRRGLLQRRPQRAHHQTHPPERDRPEAR